MKTPGDIFSKEKEILTTNIEQTKFYSRPAQRKFNLAMKIWRIPRRRMYKLIQESGINRHIFETQKKWIGDTTGKKVLDFGCYNGNSISFKMAEHADYYLGIDLSDTATSELDANLKKRGFKNAKAIAVDILSDDFTDRNFDIVYAQGVIHHFKYIDVILQRLHGIINKGGIIVTCDPLATALTSQIVRKIYHRFRTDKEWEWPFTKEIVRKIQNYFDILNIQGFMGCSKWAIPIALINKKYAIQIANKFHEKDLAEANRIGNGFWKCMQVLMCLKKR